MAKKNRTKNKTIKRTKNKKNTKNKKRIKRKSKIFKKRGGGGVKCKGYLGKNCGNYYYSWLDQWYDGQGLRAKHIPKVDGLIAPDNLCPECAKEYDEASRN